MRLPRPEADRSADTSAQVGARNDKYAFPTNPEMYFCPEADRSADTSAQVGETPAPSALRESDLSDD